MVFERLADATVPTGVTPGLAPLFSPSGLVYRYVLESPDRTPQELKTIEDWVVERAYRSVPGVADDSGFGGTTMQYQVLLDPARIYGYHLTVPQVTTALSANNANAGGGFYSQGGQFYYVRGIGLVRNTDDIGNIVVGSNKGVPIRVRDIGEVTIGHAPRARPIRFSEKRRCGRGRHPHAPRRADAERPQGSRGKDRGTEPQHPAAGRQDPSFLRSQRTGELTTDTVEANLLRGMVLVLIVLIFFLVSFRAAVIVALTIPLSLLFAFIVLHAHDVAANLLSIGAIDFGIVIGGALLDRDLDGCVRRIAPDAPVPVVDERSVRSRPGGAGSPRCSPRRARTRRARYARDRARRRQAGAQLRALLAAAGVQVVDLGLVPTPEKVRIRADGHPLLRIDRGGQGSAAAVGGCTAAARAAIGWAAAVLVADYGRGVAAEPGVREALAGLGDEVPVVWDPHPRGPEPVPGAALVTPNAAEAGALRAGDRRRRRRRSRRASGGAGRALARRTRVCDARRRARC